MMLMQNLYRLQGKARSAEYTLILVAVFISSYAMYLDLSNWIYWHLGDTIFEILRLSFPAVLLLRSLKSKNKEHVFLAVEFLVSVLQLPIGYHIRGGWIFDAPLDEARTFSNRLYGAALLKAIAIVIYCCAAIVGLVRWWLIRRAATRTVPTETA